ncbi:flavodoxin family protein [Phyllobacterium sp. K27]
MTLKALAINCTLKVDGQSSTQKMIDLIAEAFEAFGVQTSSIRLAEFNVKPGVKSDEGELDDWPSIRKRLLESDILILGTPIWMGQPSSVCKRALERMDAFLNETDDQGRMLTYGKVATVAVVGNEDGAHHVSAELYQALNDVGFSLAPNAVAYWVGEAMGSVNFVDLTKVPDTIVNTVAMMARNTAHLANNLKTNTYPGEKSRT